MGGRSALPRKVLRPGHPHRGQLYRLRHDALAPLLRRVRQSQVAQNLGRWLAHSQQVVAGAAILGDLPAVGAGVRIIVAAEAAWEIIVPDVVGVRAPGNAHGREHVAVVDAHQRAGGPRDLRATLLLQGRVVLAIITRQSGRNPRRGLLAAGIVPAQDLHAFLLDERERGRDVPGGHGGIHGALGNWKMCVGRLWQSMQSISRIGSAPGPFVPAAWYTVVRPSRPLYSTHGMVWRAWSE